MARLTAYRDACFSDLGASRLSKSYEYHSNLNHKRIKWSKPTNKLVELVYSVKNGNCDVTETSPADLAKSLAFSVSMALSQRGESRNWLERQHE